VVLFDERTYRAAGERCVRDLAAAGFDISPHRLDDADGHEPVCDDLTRATLQASLPAADAIIGVGSGVISDLSKWIAFERGIPAAVIGTAASMNGYAAANVAPSVAGVKTLIHARAHRLIAADPAVLASAPRELTSAGLGDVIAKTVSSVDWKMNELLFGEGYSPAIAGIVDHVQARFLAEPSKLRAGDPDAVSGLFEALVYSGCAMTLQGSSLPASGGEHLISHALDMRAMAEGGRHDLHGRQVGLGTIFAAALYQAALTQPSPRFRSTPLPFDRRGWGPIAGSVAEHYEKQSARFAAACGRLRGGDTWARLREQLLPMLPDPAWIKDVLAEAGAAHRIEDIGIERERFVWAARNGAQMRERFTSLDLGWATGVLPDQIEVIVERYLMR
jgi:glycerol-1-phosphate dehydrogenase [NAD(P)+]